MTRFDERWRHLVQQARWPELPRPAPPIHLARLHPPVRMRPVLSLPIALGAMAALYVLAISLTVSLGAAAPRLSFPHLAVPELPDPGRTLLRVSEASHE